MGVGCARGVGGHGPSHAHCGPNLGLKKRWHRNSDVVGGEDDGDGVGVFRFARLSAFNLSDVSAAQRKTDLLMSGSSLKVMSCLPM